MMWVCAVTRAKGEPGHTGILNCDVGDLIRSQEITPREVLKKELMRQNDLVTQNT